MFDVMTLSAELTLDADDYDKKLARAEAGAEKAGTFIGKVLGQGTVMAVKGLAAGVTAASGAITVLTKQAVDGYANFEQLAGGVETLFGESANQVMQYANSAFATTGMSANQYMETVTGFSASLLQSLGGDTAKAADVADMAMRDMADNANKMGTSLESIRNAYQGFAKQNYTMLDNLKLGYGGTKQEMERLLADAEALSGVHYDISSFSDMAEAIHVVQQEMGITGTTAKEASDTITGSVAGAKAAWQNLVTGLADENANMSELITIFLDQASGALSNLLPRFTQALEGVGQFIETAAPQIFGKLAEILNDVAPTILDAAKSLMDSLIAVFPDLITGIKELLPQLIDTGIELLMSLLEGFVSAFPDLMEGAVEAITTLLNSLLDHLPEIVSMGIQILISLVGGIIKAIPEIVKAMPKVITAIAKAIVAGIKEIAKAGLELGKAIIDGIWSGISGGAKKLKDGVSTAFAGFKQGVKDFFGINSPSKWGKEMGAFIMDGFGIGLDDGGEKVENGLKGTLGGIAKSFAKGISEIETSSFPLLDAMNTSLGAVSVSGMATEIGTAPNAASQASVAMMNNMAKNDSSSITHTTIIEIDGKEVAKAVDSPLKQMEKMRGSSLIGGYAY